MQPIRSTAHFQTIRRTGQQTRIASQPRRCHRRTTVPQSGHKSGHRHLRTAFSYSEKPVETSVSRTPKSSQEIVGVTPELEAEVQRLLAGHLYLPRPSTTHQLRPCPTQRTYSGSIPTRSSVVHTERDLHLPRNRADWRPVLAGEHHQPSPFTRTSTQHPDLLTIDLTFFPVLPTKNGDESGD